MAPPPSAPARHGGLSSSRRLVALLVAMVVVPISALGFLGMRLVEGHAALAQVQVTSLIQDRLREVDASVARFMDDKRRDLLRFADDLPPDPLAIRQHLREAQVRLEVLVLGQDDGRLRFPTREGALTRDDRELLIRTRTVWEGDALLRAVSDASRAGEDHGWLPFFHGGGLHLLLWVADGDRVVAVELPRIALLAELVAHLPATGPGADDRTPYRTILVDASGTSVYEWGSYQAPATVPPIATVPLSPPLSTWGLRHYAPATELPTALTRSLVFNLAIMLLAVSLALSGLAVYLYRVRNREMRLAAQRVSFVNQVSHELKTPLTNIRLYAELLATDLGYEEEELTDGDARDPAARYLGVITGESQRLSRLITNVLTFARGQEGRLEVRPQARAVDGVVRSVYATFAPSLEQAGVTIHLDLAAPEPVHVDPDALEQILANLLNNVEKYARVGGEARISTRREGDAVVIRVADRGPGVPEGQRERIFEPFHRVGHALTEGVTGTGIGLDIARRLARLHGGDLRLVPSELGAAFEVTLHAPLAGPPAGAPRERPAPPAPPAEESCP